MLKGGMEIAHIWV